MLSVTMKKAMIRKITDSDVKKLAELEKQCFLNVWTEKNIKDAIDNERNILLGVCDNFELCGYIFADFILDEVNINRIAIAPNHRNSGLATALLIKLEDYVASFAKRIMLEVRQSNTNARSLYEKNGFEVVGVRKGFYSEPFEDAILMTKFLKEMEQ